MTAHLTSLSSLPQFNNLFEVIVNLLCFLCANICPLQVQASCEQSSTFLYKSSMCLSQADLILQKSFLMVWSSSLLCRLDWKVCLASSENDLSNERILLSISASLCPSKDICMVLSCSSSARKAMLMLPWPSVLTNLSLTCETKSNRLQGESKQDVRECCLYVWGVKVLLQALLEFSETRSTVRTVSSREKVAVE